MIQASQRAGGSRPLRFARKGRCPETARNQKLFENRGYEEVGGLEATGTTSCRVSADEQSEFVT